ncbi:MAG: hypothetical protein RI949_2431 [Pseudomonadota bacterium]|jgi:drug/metabolite transporter (DMT)-like permease
MIDRSSVWPALALVANALTWGLSWLPFRWMASEGWHPLWATVLVYSWVILGITLWRPAAWRELCSRPSLGWLVLAAGTTNAAFNWAVTTGDVVRVVLLFYLMPLWAVILARWILHEPLSRLAALRVGLALSGAVIVLWPDQAQQWPLPRSLPDWLGVVGGFSFALNNVMLRREAHQPAHARLLAMFVGGALLAGLTALAVGAHAGVHLPQVGRWDVLLFSAAVAWAFLGGNLALQYGAARLPANATAVLMITEVLFASVSSILLGSQVMTTQLLWGGTLIVSASLLVARR